MRDKFLVVLMRDSDADFVNPGRGYPVPLWAHGDVLQIALCQGPAAVFVDMNFRWERTEGDAAKLADALRHRKTGGGCEPQPAGSEALKKTSPVFVAFIPSASSKCAPLALSTEEDCDERRRLAPLREAVIPVAMPGTDDTRRYVLLDTELQRDVPGSTSPALELFQHVCAVDPGYGPGCQDQERILEGLRKRHARPSLAVRWGYYTAPLPAADGSVPKSGCPVSQQEAAKSFTDWLRQLLKEAFNPRTPQEKHGGNAAGANNGVPSGLGQQGWCSYHAAISSKDFIEMASRDLERLRRLVQDRIVIYGADITAVNDLVVSPVLGALPGAHIHAMAADNLLSFGAAYWRDAPVAFLGIRWNEWVEWFLSLCAIAAGTYVTARQSHAKTCMQRLRIGWGYMIVSILVIAGVAYWLSLTFNWSPINCLGLLGVVSLSAPKLIFVNTKSD